MSFVALIIVGALTFFGTWWFSLNKVIGIGKDGCYSLWDAFDECNGIEIALGAVASAVIELIVVLLMLFLMSY